MIDAGVASMESHRVVAAEDRACLRLLMCGRTIDVRAATWIAAVILWSMLGVPAAAAIEGPAEQRIENFSLPDFHGQLHALDDYPDRVVVLAFLGTECPLAKLYALRLVELAAEFAAKGVVFLGIDSNLQDSLTDLGVFARAHRVTFPLLKDNNNVLADRLGAQRTPEVFLVDRQRIVRYRGRIDDQYGLKSGTGYAKSKLEERSLANAVNEVLQEKPVTHPIRPAQGCLIGRVAKIAPQGNVTYANQIARIMQQRCVECHRTGQLAPFSLTSYDEVTGWAAMMLEVVEQGRMPPWFADPRYGHFSNDRRLSEEERQQLVTWVENGCPRGEDRDLPAPARFSEGWQMGEPDQIVYMRDEPFDVPAEGVVEYQYFTVDPGWETEKWIVATEARPGNRAVVHHNVVWVQSGPASETEPTEAIAWYGPGFSPFYCSPGTAMYVPAHAKLRFSMHYTANGTAQSDRSMVGIRFADPSTVQKLVRIPYMTDRNLKIPPGDPNYEVNDERTVWHNLLIYGLLPHMHLRGKSFLCEAEYTDGHREVLLDVPRYDPNWQLRYIFAEPKLLPAGSKLHFRAHYDNSVDNPANPDPTKTVTVGQQTWDEMFECQYMSVDADFDSACRALVAASVSRDLEAAQDGTIAAGVRQLLACGAERTPEASAAIEMEYLELKFGQPADPRVDVAFALALNNQRQFSRGRRIAEVCLQANPANVAAHKARIWAGLSLQKRSIVLADLEKLADQFAARRDSVADEELASAAYALGAALACTSLLPADSNSAQAKDCKANILRRLGPVYQAKFLAGERAVADQWATQKTLTPDECLTQLGRDAFIGYEAESRRLLNSSANRAEGQPPVEP